MAATSATGDVADDAQRGFAHGRTLLGAIDAFLGSLAHNRPWLHDVREAELAPMAGAWLGAGGPNWLPSLDVVWIRGHLTSLPPPRVAARRDAVADLIDWAVAEGLLEPGMR